VAVLGFCLAVALVWSTPALAASKVGFINLQRLVNESKMGQAAREDLVRLRGKKQEAVNRKQKEIENLRDEITQKGDKMDPREKRDKIEILQKTYKEFQRMVADAREDITREDKELVALILEKADGVLKEVAKKQGYTIILKDANAIGYLDPDVDITDAVLKALNRKK
jgi:outer membrane protein